MKKLNITLLLLLVSIVASFAQMPYKQQSSNLEKVKSTNFKVDAKKINSELQKKKSGAKASSSKYWVNFGDALDIDANFSGIISTSANTLGYYPIYPDSMPKVIGTTSTFHWGNSHAYADIFSPSSNFIGTYVSSASGLGVTNANLFFNRNSTFLVDSIKIRFAYLLNTAATNDTLFFYYRSVNNILESNLAGWPPGTISPTDSVFQMDLAYDYKKNAPTTASGFTKVAIPLTIADTSNFGSSRTIPVNLTLSASNVTTGQRFGSSILTAFSFKTSQPHTLNDTLICVGCTVHNKLNSLEILYYNESAAGNPTSYTYEHSLNFGYIATKSVRYNISSTGWNGQYLPAYAFNTPFFQHPYTDFHLNYEGSAFTYTKAITTYKFTDISNFTPTSWSWDFGDGIGTDNVKNPTYTYTTNGTYSVCLTATSATKTYTSCRSIKITNVGVDNVSEFTLGNVYPNPISIGTMMNIPVELNGTSNQAIVKVYNTVGAVVSETKQTVNEKVTVSTENLTAGMYMFSVEINGQKTTGKFSVVE